MPVRELTYQGCIVIMVFFLPILLFHNVLVNLLRMAIKMISEREQEVKAVENEVSYFILI